MGVVRVNYDQDLKTSRLHDAMYHWVKDGVTGTLGNPVVDPGIHGEAP